MLNVRFSILLVIVCATSAINLGAYPPAKQPAVYFVDGTNSLASDLNPGTESLPWKTIQQAATQLKAGDTVYIKAGIYSGDVQPANSGTVDAWITYRAYPGQEQLAALDHARFWINQKSYLKVIGLKVQYSSHEGILVTGPGGNYVIEGNYTYDTGSSGIAVWGVPYGKDPGLYNFKAVTNVVIANNIIEKACDGGWNEQLDIANGVDGFEVRSNILMHGTNAINGGEGIDVKEGASNGRIWGNQIFDLLRYGIYLDAGNATTTIYKIRPGLLTKIDVYNNLVHNNAAHGIGVTSEGRGNLDGIRIFNNICYSNAGDGILLYHYPHTTNYARNITIINNTTYNNNNSTSAPYYGGIATDHDTASHVIIRNNLCYETLHGAFGVKKPMNPAAIVDHNFNSSVNPGFVDVDHGNFHLRTNSQAIATGSVIGAPRFDFDGQPRPVHGAVDPGALEHRSVAD